MNLINKNFATAYGWLCDNMGVADQLDLSRKTGLAQNTISHILRGKGGVSLKTMRKLNEAFGNVFNMAFLRGESSVMLAADIKYDASCRHVGRGVCQHLWSQHGRRVGDGSASDVEECHGRNTGHGHHQVRALQGEQGD